MKGKALRRALQTSHVVRINADVPLITDATELMTPETAYDMLLKNANNRPINWKKVEEYAAIMSAGKWQLHSQGIILDPNGNILTGQKRLWAVIYSNTAVYMRVSRGNPSTVANLLDRGTPQSSRDLASRETGRKHTPIEASIGRAILAMRGIVRPSTDELASAISQYSTRAAMVMKATAGTKKTRSIVMILAAICEGSESLIANKAVFVEKWAKALEDKLAPQTPEQCWGRGAAFALAMNQARQIVEFKN